MVERVGLIRSVLLIVGSYAFLLAAGLRWHWAGGPPYDRASPGLLTTFATVATLVGLVSIWSAFAVIHWSTRASGLIAGTAMVAGLMSFFLEWNNFLVWQLVAIVYAQLAFLILALSLFRLFGYSIMRDLTDHAVSQPSARSGTARRSQFTVRNLFLLTSALWQDCPRRWYPYLSFGHVSVVDTSCFGLQH